MVLCGPSPSPASVAVGQKQPHPSTQKKRGHQSTLCLICQMTPSSLFPLRCHSLCRQMIHKIVIRCIRPSQHWRRMNSSRQQKRTRGCKLRNVEPRRVPLHDALGRARRNSPASVGERAILTRREARASRRLCAGGGSCSWDWWRLHAWRTQDCRSGSYSEN